MKKGIIHLLPVIAVAIVLTLGVAVTVAIKNSQDTNQSKILSSSDDRDDDNSGSSGSSNSGPSSSSDRDEESNDRSGSLSLPGSSTPNVTSGPNISVGGPSIRRVDLEDDEKDEDEDEIQDMDKDEVEDLEDEIEEVQRVRFEQRDGRFEIETREATGAARQRIRVEERPDRFEFRYKIGENEVKIRFKDGKFKITQQGVEATTLFPIEVNQETQTIAVTTPKGTVNIQVLPNQAINNLVSNNVFENDEIDEVELVENEKEEGINETVFKVRGVRTVKIFGLFDFQFPQEVDVGTTDGTIVSQTRPLSVRILSFLLPGF